MMKPPSGSRSCFNCRRSAPEPRSEQRLDRTETTRSGIPRPVDSVPDSAVCGLPEDPIEALKGMFLKVLKTPEFVRCVTIYNEIWAASSHSDQMRNELNAYYARLAMFHRDLLRTFATSAKARFDGPHRIDGYFQSVAALGRWRSFNSVGQRSVMSAQRSFGCSVYAVPQLTAAMSA